MRKRRRPRPQPDRALSLVPVTRDCPESQHRLQARYNNFRTITTLDGVLRLTLSIRRCPNPDCLRFLRPYRPEAEPHLALPYHEFGLDVLALVGRLRHAEHRSIPEIHQELTRRALGRPRPPPRPPRGCPAVAWSSLNARSPTSWTATTSSGRWPRPTPSGWDRCCATSDASSWPSMDCSPTSATRCPGSCATASPGRSF